LVTFTDYLQEYYFGQNPLSYHRKWTLSTLIFIS